MKSSPYVEIGEWGVRKGEVPDLLITTLHGETAQDGPVFKAIPDLRAHLHPDDEEIFGDYLDLDADAYTESLAWAFILQLRGRRPDLYVRWAQVKVHRAVLDCNRRVFADAARKIWNPEMSHGDLLARLELIHEETMATLLEAAGGVPRVFDIHSMYPFSPAAPQVAGHQALQEQGGRLSDYVDLYLESPIRGTPRPVDVLVKDGERKEVANLRLAAELLIGLQGAGVHARVDEPYNLGSKRIVTKDLLSGKQVGACIDVPKNFFRRSRDMGSIFLEGEQDDDKVEMFADVLVDAWLKRV